MREQGKDGVSATKVEYSYAGKEALEDVILKSFPKQLRPTKKTGTYLGMIFFLSIIISLFQFPYGSLMTLNTDVVINVGYPRHFFEFNLGEPEKNPLLIGGLILDLLIYLLIAYSIDISINLILKNPLLKSKKDSKRQPKVFENRKTIAEKLTEKVIEKTTTQDNPSNP